MNNLFRHLFLVFVWAGSPSAYACEAQLLALKPYLHKVSRTIGLPPQGSELTGAVNTLLQEEGGSVRLLGRGAFGSVYRWTREGQPSLVIKHYKDSQDAELDNRLLQLLREETTHDDWVQVIAEARPRNGSMYFYQDIAGVTFSTAVIKDYFPSELISAMRDDFRYYFDGVGRRLAKKYQYIGPSSLLEPPGVDPHDSYIALHNLSFRLGPGEYAYYNVHESNMVIEAATGRLWIIDPR